MYPGPSTITARRRGTAQEFGAHGRTMNPYGTGYPAQALRGCTGPFDGTSFGRGRGALGDSGRSAVRQIHARLRSMRFQAFLDSLPIEGVFAAFAIIVTADMGISP